MGHEINGLGVVEPGDTVILTFPGDVTLKYVRETIKNMTELLPDVHWLGLWPGMSALIVPGQHVRADDSD